MPVGDNHGQLWGIVLSCGGWGGGGTLHLKSNFLGVPLTLVGAMLVSSTLANMPNFVWPQAARLLAFEGSALK